METLKILNLEDSEDDAGLISLALRKNSIPFTLKRVDTREEFIEGIENFKPDVILSDHTLPQFNSVEAFALYKEKNIQIPFILVTGTVSEEFAVSVIKKGADDYILKSNLSRLPSAIVSALDKRTAQQEKLKADQKLHLYNEELVKVNKELDNFVYSASHNLRAPLLSMLGLINLINMDSQPKSPVSNYLQMMEQSVLQLDKTLRDILEYSHNSHDEIDVQKIEWQNLIDKCFEHFLHIKDIHKIERQIDIQEKHPFFSDAHRLETLLRNLVSNSINYRDPNKEKMFISITISMDADQATIVVEDNGLGIDKELLPKVFGLFYRGNEKSEGAGLGLYIANEIIHRLNGTIELISEEKKGTKAIIVIPNREGEPK